MKKTKKKKKDREMVKGWENTEEDILLEKEKDIKNKKDPYYEEQDKEIIRDIKLEEDTKYRELREIIRNIKLDEDTEYRELKDLEQ